LTQDYEFWNKTVPYYVEFVKRVFCEFNGKINKFCLPELYIDYDINSEDFGQMGVAKCVTVAVPAIILGYINRESYIKAVNKDYFIKSLLVDTTLHELAHHDQNYDYKMYNENELYHQKVESGVINYVHNYIVENLDYIQTKFGFIFDFSIIHYEYYTEDFIKFSGYSQYYANLLYWILNFKFTLEELNSLIYYSEKVILTLNGIQYLIKENATFYSPPNLFETLKDLFSFDTYSSMVSHQARMEKENDQIKVFEMIFDVEPGVRNMITTKVKV